MSQPKNPTVKFGDVTIDLIEYASRANAILGIRDSGKTITAKFFAEALHAAGIPFIALDPSGSWKALRLPGKGPGLPVVVAGSGGDLPLTAHTAAAIVEAAMKGGVSLVIDLSGAEYSKADWRRIVMAVVNTLLRKNAQYGLRHLFLEEAAEFVPQKPIDGETFAAVEKLARIGGNSSVGLTLINQRAAEVAKSVLELCDNLFLHRQRGFRSIENLQKWMDIAEVAEAGEIVKSLSSLPTGECWAWLAEQNLTAHRVKVPMIQSGHPDRRNLRGAVSSKKAVDVGAFVEVMRADLGKVEEEAKANDPKALKAEIATLRRQMTEAARIASATGTAIDPKAIEEAERRGDAAGHARGYADGNAAGFTEATKLFDAAIEALRGAQERADARLGALIEAKRDIKPAPAPARAAPARPASPARAAPPRAGLSNGAGVELTGPQRQLLRALAWWKAMGHDRPSRPQVAGIAGWKITSGHLKNVVGSLKTAGLVEYPDAGHITLTEAGAAAAPDPDMSVTLHDGVRSVLTNPQRQIFETLLTTGEPMLREAIAAACGWEPTSGHLKNIIGSLRTLEIVEYPSSGQVALQEWVSP